METVHVNGSLEKLASAVRETCENAESSTIENLVIAGTFPMSQLDSPLMNDVKNQARIWQGAHVEDTFFTHGEYMDRGGIPGKKYIVDELTKRHTSKRALVSLLGMSDIVGSGDRPIPSFLVAQFGFHENDTRRLHVGSYYRALEVANFLPVNLAEHCLLIEGLVPMFPQMQEFSLTILAFIAYSNPRSNNLRLHELDTESPARVVVAVARKEYGVIRRWLSEKAEDEITYVEIEGIETLFEAISLYRDDYGDAIYYSLDSALRSVRSLRALVPRVSTTTNAEAQSKYGELREALRTTIAELDDLRVRKEES